MTAASLRFARLQLHTCLLITRLSLPAGRYQLHQTAATPVMKRPDEPERSSRPAGTADLRMTSPVILLVLPVKPVRSSASRRRNQDIKYETASCCETNVFSFCSSPSCRGSEASWEHSIILLLQSRDRPCCWVPLLHPLRLQTLL